MTDIPSFLWINVLIRLSRKDLTTLLMVSKSMNFLAKKTLSTMLVFNQLNYKSIEKELQEKKNNHLIRSITWKSDESSAQDTLIDVLNLCTNVRHLNFTPFRKTEWSPDIDYFTRPAVKMCEVISKMAKLGNLVLNTFDLRFFTTAIPNLECLTVKDWNPRYEYSQTTVFELSIIFPNLKILNFKNASNSYISIQRCNLKKLSMVGFSSGSRLGLPQGFRLENTVEVVKMIQVDFGLSRSVISSVGNAHTLICDKGVIYELTPSFISSNTRNIFIEGDFCHEALFKLVQSLPLLVRLKTCLFDFTNYSKPIEQQIFDYLIKVKIFYKVEKCLP